MGNTKKKINKASKKDVIKQSSDNSNVLNAVLVISATVIAVAIIVAAIVAVVGGVMEKNAAPGDLVSFESEHFEVTNGMLSYYFYSDYYTELTNNYYMYYYYGLDTSESLKNQTYNSGDDSSTTTWFDYFVSNTANSVSTYLLFAEKGYDEGVKELPEEDYADVDKTIASLQKNADSLGLELAEYIEFMYGDGVTEEDVRDAVEFQLLAMKQYEKDYNSLEFSEEECEEAYDADPTVYSYIDYRSFTFTAAYPDDEEDTEGREAAEVIAKQLADELAATSDETEFVSYINSYLVSENAKLDDESKKTDDDIAEEVAATLTERSVYSTDTDFGSWAFTDGRTNGDTTVIDNGDGSYTVYLIIRTQYRLDYNTKNVRHILINTSNYDSGEEAYAKAQEVFELYNSGEKGEDAFDALAEEYNEDSSSLYENIMLDQMVDEFESWCFDESRKEGDCEIVESSYGYHIIYFVGDGDIAWKAEVETDLVSEAFQTLLDEYEAEYELSFETDYIYKLSGYTAYSKSADTTAAETTSEPEDTASDDTAADDTSEDSSSSEETSADDSDTVEAVA